MTITLEDIIIVISLTLPIGYIIYLGIKRDLNPDDHVLGDRVHNNLIQIMQVCAIALLICILINPGLDEIFPLLSNKNTHDDDSMT